MNTLTSEILITKTKKSRIGELDPENIQFGKKYSDHMLMAYYEDGDWQKTEIVPFEDITFSPATSFIHYGQAIFEGVKAYKNVDGNPVIFRPRDNWMRMLESAKRMDMPDVPEEIFLEGLRQLVNLDREWVPAGEATSLYIRPYMVATDKFIGVRPSEKYLFSIITSPAGPYYSKPMSIYVQDKYVRAFPGGTGNIKAAGNYGMSMYPSHMVKNMGYNEILWTDGFEHKYVQEIGTMNVFFVIGDTVITPDLNAGTILAGITRDSVITLLKEKGIKIEERPISIDEIEDAYKSGTLKEAFGTGTAASVSTIQRLTYRDTEMVLQDLERWDVVNWVKKELSDIRHGRIADRHGWIFKI
jgi:branched-chain amino acid aminotransferase